MKLIFIPRTFPILLLIFGLSFVSTNLTFANVDTIYAGIPAGQFGTSCIDATSFPNQNIQTITNFCPDQSGTFANFSMLNPESGCISYFGLAEGASLGCFEICDDAQNCDTVYLYLNTDPPTPLNFACDTLIGPEVMNISHSNCAVDATICLPIRFDLLSTLEVYDNGVLYANGMSGCNVDTTVAYTYNNLFGQGATSTGPYFLDSWSINGDEYSGGFADIDALLDSLNTWDTLGVWIFDMDVPFTIKGGFSENFYGSIIASKPGVINSTSIMGANYGLTPLGSEVQLALGNHLITIVDNNTACTDSVQINVACLPSDSLSLTTYINVSGSICVDTSDLVGNFVSLENVCGDASNPGIGTDVFPNDNCFEWETLQAGNQQICMVACDDLGFCDTTFISYLVIDPQTDTIDVVLAENDSDYFCLDSTELMGLVNSFTLASTPNVVEITLDTIDFCLEITSTIDGSEVVCAVICDDQGGCDTTCFNILVNDNAAGNPVANDDSDSTGIDMELALDFLANDTFMLGDTIRILTPPNIGYLTQDSLGNYSYTPNTGLCGDDFFTYEICNSIGCDVATVNINVACIEVIVYDGFSPNGDDVNDTFLIRGLQGFPNHKIHVFNRWGNMVFEGVEYKNNWDGVWNGKRLPQGVYFYVVELNDPENIKLSGALNIAY